MRTAEQEEDYVHAHKCYALLLDKKEKAKRKDEYNYKEIKGNVGVALRVLSGYKHCDDLKLLKKAFDVLLASGQKISLFTVDYIDIEFFADPKRFNAFARDQKTKIYNKDVEHYFAAAIDSKKISPLQALRSPLADMLSPEKLRLWLVFNAQAARCFASTMIL